MAGYVFVVSPGSNISRNENNIVITSEKEKIRIPIGAVEHIFIFGGVNITTPTLRFIASKDKCVFFLNKFGKNIATLTPQPYGSDFRLRLAQYELLNNDKKRFNLIGYLLKKKAAGVGYVVTSGTKGYRGGELIDSFVKTVKFKKLEEALGIDGNLNKTMFGYFRETMLPDYFEFEGREYYPPKDEVNAMLSLTYSIYYSILISIAIAEGFDPYLGFFHVKRGRHASFCSDIIEVSRPWLTLFVFRLLKEGYFFPEDFVKSQKGCFFKEKALKVFLKLFTERVLHGKEASFLEYTQDFLKEVREILLR